MADEANVKELNISPCHLARQWCSLMGVVCCTFVMGLFFGMRLLPASETPSTIAVIHAPATSTTKSAVPPPPERAIVVAGYSANPMDLTWLLYYLGDFCVVVVDHQDFDGRDATTVAIPNVGREGHNFFHFIIHHYSALPGHTAFIHGHRFSHHQGDHDLAVILRYARWDLPYVNLNYGGQYRISPEGVLAHYYLYMASVWPILFEPYFGRIPPYFDIDCCAQFIVSRENLLWAPLAFWRNYSDWAATPTNLDANGALEINGGNFEPSIFLIEHMWTFLLNQGAWDRAVYKDADAAPLADGEPLGNVLFMERQFCAQLTRCPLPKLPTITSRVRASHLDNFFQCREKWER